MLNEMKCRYSSGKNKINKFPGFAFALFFFLIIHCTFHIENCYADWVQVSSGMSGLTVLSLANSGNNIFAGTYFGVYLSTNNGTSWTQTSLNTVSVLALAANGNNVFAGGVGVFLSTNNGTTWTQSSLTSQTIASVAVNGNNVFAGSIVNNGVYLSTNNGTLWTQTTLNNRNVYSLAVNGNNIFAGTETYGVYFSANNGTSWTQTTLNNVGVVSLAVNGNNVFAGSDGSGVYISTNNGISWTQTTLSNLGVISLVVNGNNVFAGTDGSGVYVSNNNGTSWSQKNEGLGNARVNAFCILNTYIFAGISDNSVYRRPLSEVIGIKPISNEIPINFSLSQNYPNPFNPGTKIKFALAKNSFIKLIIYDALGREIETLVKEQLKTGIYEVDFDGNKFSSGVYYYKLVVSDNTNNGLIVETKKMVLVK